MTYQEYKAELIAKYGVEPEFNYDRQPMNEPARLLMEFKIKLMQDARAIKKLSKQTANNLIEPVVEPTASILGPNVVEVDREAVNKALTNLSGVVPLEQDLEAFKGVDRDVLRVYLTNQDIEPKKLANSFGKSYQYIAGLLNSKAVLALRAKYFYKQLDNNTKIGLLKLTEEADPKIVLAAAEYLKVLHEADKDDSGSRIQDPKAEKALRLLADWLADGAEGTLTIQSIDLV